MKMQSNRIYSTVQLPPLKVKTKEKHEPNLLAPSPEELNGSPTFTHPFNILQSEQNDDNYGVDLENSVPLLNLSENGTSSIATLPDSETSDVPNKFNELSPRSEADFVLQEILNLIKTTKVAENRESEEEFVPNCISSKLLDELTECARNQVALLILRDCCLRLVEGTKFVERLKYLCETEQDFVINAKKKEFESAISTVLNESELTKLSENLHLHSKNWSFIESRLKSCEILHMLNDIVNDQINHFKIKLNNFIFEVLMRTQELLNLMIKSLTLLDAVHYISDHKTTWKGIVLVCEQYNEVCAKFNFNDSSEFFEYFSLDRLLGLIAKECGIIGLDLFYNLLVEPMRQEDISITNKVEWISESSARHSKKSNYQTSLTYCDTKNAKGEPNENQNGAVMNEDGDLLTGLLLSVSSSSNLVSTSSVKNKEKSEKIVAENCTYFESNISLSFWTDFYVKLLGNEILSGLEMKCIDCRSDLACTILWWDSMILAISSRADELALNVDAPYVSEIYRKVAISLKLQAALSAWDERMCSALPACQNHRFPKKLTVKNEVVTEAGYCVSSALEPLLALLPTFQTTEDGDNSWQLPQTLIVPCLNATLAFTQRWLANSTTQLLATWQLDAYLLITHSDLKNIVDLLKHISAVCYSSFNTSISSSISLSTRLYVRLMSELWDEVNKMSSEIQNIASSSIHKFYQRCNYMSCRAFANHMPVGKIWRKKYRSNGPPDVHSQYIDNIIGDVLEPVLDGVKNLSMPEQISIVSMATKAFCESWMVFICKNKIKFSLHGALLFRLDVVHLSSWLRSIPELSIEAQQSIQALDVLRRLHGSSILLTRQPRSRQRFRKTKVSPISTIADLNLDSTLTVEELSTDDSVTDEDFVPNKDEWLALRAHGNSARWHSLWCLSQHQE